MDRAGYNGTPWQFNMLYPITRALNFNKIELAGELQDEDFHFFIALSQPREAQQETRV